MKTFYQFLDESMKSDHMPGDGSIKTYKGPGSRVVQHGDRVRVVGAKRLDGSVLVQKGRYKVQVHHTELEESEQIDEAVKKSSELKRFNFGADHAISVHKGGLMGDMEAGDITHGHATRGKMKAWKVPHHEEDDYGPRVRFRVENNKTGAVTHHSVYQRGKDHDGKHIISVRSYGTPNVAHKAHAEIIHGLLGKKL